MMDVPAKAFRNNEDGDGRVTLDQHLANLSGAVGALDEMIGKLIRRIEPVLRPVDDDSTEARFDAEKKSMHQSAVAHAVDDFSELLHRIRATVADVERRVEL